MLAAMDISHGGSSGRSGDRLAKFTHGARLRLYVSPQLLEGTAKPIKFKMRGFARVGIIALVDEIDKRTVLMMIATNKRI